MGANGNDDDEGIANDTFPLDHHDLSHILMITHLVRSRLDRLSARHLRSAAALLFALERLPKPTPSVQIVFGFRTPTEDGNWSWADIGIDAESLRLSVGAHFYDPAVGGNTESEDIFKSFAGSSVSRGDISDWMNRATPLFEEGLPTIQDESEHGKIDWYPEEDD